MTLSVKHAFATTKADGTDSTLVKPSNWNAEHSLTVTGDSVVLGRAAGAGPGPVTDIPYQTIVSLVLPPGIILPYAGSTPPAGFVLCDGSSYLRSAQPALFAVISTLYGLGTDTVNNTTFAVPDMRGRSPAAPGGTMGWTLAGKVGNAANRQVRHYGYTDVNVNVGGANWSDGTNFYYSGGFGSAGAGSGAGSNFVTSGNAPNVYTPWSGSGSGSGTIRNDGNNLTDAFDIIQPVLIVNYIIKL